jgi:hypothetical protein
MVPTAAAVRLHQRLPRSTGAAERERDRQRTDPLRVGATARACLVGLGGLGGSKGAAQEELYLAAARQFHTEVCRSLSEVVVPGLAGVRDVSQPKHALRMLVEKRRRGAT